ncbi:neuropeptide Y receptor type 5-like, partial [Drosophila serrata]|uniref:neuropeptide Y receptor type 5-like n=1 Tax=Drosophila serrata TaxID=7274 RepID=UPI000A1D1F8C
MSPAEQLPLVGGVSIGGVGVTGGVPVAYQLAASTSGGAGGAGGGSVGDPGGVGAGGGGDKLKEMPDKYVVAISQFLDWHGNETSDMERLSGPILKSSIKSVYWLFLIQYAALAVLGVVLNVAIVVYIMYHRLYKDVTHAFIINLALCHFVQCALVLPVSLMVMLIQNWIFGQFLCFFLPMLQDIPLHVAMISHILIAWDRMRWLNDPLKGRLPGFVCCCATWLTGMVIALPYPIYTIYVELG